MIDRPHGGERSWSHARSDSIYLLTRSVGATGLGWIPKKSPDFLKQIREHRPYDKHGKQRRSHLSAKEHRGRKQKRRRWDGGGTNWVEVQIPTQ